MKFIEDLDSKFDIKSVPLIDIIIRSGVSLEKQGKIYRAKCPFHNEKTPSFTVYLNNHWKCFGCGKYGDEIEFVKQRYGLSFKEACQWIEDNFAFNIKSEPIIQREKPQPKIVPPNFVIYYHNSLQPEHRAYFYSRGFTDEIINREMWGWNGNRYAIPVWEGEPGNSTCLGIRLRKSSYLEDNSPKYIGLEGFNNSSVVWGKWHCKSHKTILAFAGEFDAALAIQLGLPGFSIVNGINSIGNYPENWPNVWFPDSKNLIVCFDRKEEIQGAKLAHSWNKYKTTLSARVFTWPISVQVKDFGEYYLKCKEDTVKKFIELLTLQKLSYML